MKVLGLRCSNKEYTFAVLGGTRDAPAIIAMGSFPYPKGYPKPQSLKWFYQEVEEQSRNHGIDVISLKGAEPMAARGKAYTERVEYEAAAFLAGAMLGIRRIVKKISSTMAKDLGLKGKSSYLRTKLDASSLPGFTDQPPKMQEALLVAWSELH